MITKRELKSALFEYDDEHRLFTIKRKDFNNTLVLTKIEAGSLSRLIFSVFQYHSHPKKSKQLELLRKAGEK